MPSYTLAEIEARIYNELDQNAGLYPETQVRRVINQGLRRLNLLTGFYQDTVALSGFSVAGQQVYDVPTGIVVPMSVWFERRELSKSSLTDIAQGSRDWCSDTTANAGPVQRWAPVGLKQLVIYPVDAAGGRLIEVSGIAPVPPLTAPGSVVVLDNQFVDILVGYGRSRVQLKLPGEVFAGASLAYQEMVRCVKTMTIWQDMKMQPYWIIQQLDPAAGKAE